MRFTLPTLLIFAVVISGFFLIFGLPVDLDSDSPLSQRRINRAWLYCSLLFVSGTVTACFGDKQYGLFPPVSLRWAFILFGGFIMIASVAWMYSLQTLR